jgi:hypothetical protein
MLNEQSDETARDERRDQRETGPRFPGRRRTLLGIGAALVLGAIFFPYDATVDDGTRRVRLTRVRPGVYETSARDGPVRIFYMEHCTAPANDTRVLVRKGPTFAGLDFADVRFPTGEFCSAAIVFGTRREDQGVVRTAYSPRREAPHAP